MSELSKLRRTAKWREPQEEAEEEEDSQVGEELKDVSECLCPVQFPRHG